MGENIGATARVMWNFGLDTLRLVAPRDGWPNEKAATLSSGGGQVLDKCIVYATIEESIDDLNFVFATTIRNRKYSKDVFNPHEGMQFAHELLAQGDSLGILFGSERAGLEGKEIALANAIISIPVNPKFKSLNLSHAAGLLAYEWFKMSELGKKVDTNILFKDLKSATHSEINSFILNLKTELNRSGYFWPEAKRISLQRNLENLFHRLPLTGPDIRTLFGIIKSLTKLKDR